MKLDEVRIVLRPRSVSELMDLALRFMTEAAGKRFLQLGLLVLVPAWALCMVARWLWQWEWVAVWTLALLLATPLQGVFTVAVGRLMFAEDVGLREILAHTLRRMPAYLATLFVTRVMIGVASLAFFLILPPLWVWGRCAYVHEACLLEQGGPIESITRAGRMISRNAMGAVGLMLMLSLAGLTFIAITALLVDDGLFDFILQIGKPFGSLFDEGGSAAAVLGLFLAVPYWATARFLAYVDLRTRRDGWDVQLRFMAIANRATGASQEGAA